jgi:Ca2+-binding EF-hand superfamily protein
VPYATLMACLLTYFLAAPGCSDRLGKDLNEAELKEAINVLDTNKNGYIEFNEFVAWWTAKAGGAPDAPQQ